MQDNDNHYGGQGARPKVMIGNTTATSWSAPLNLVSRPGEVWGSVTVVHRKGRTIVLHTRSNPRRGFIQRSDNLTSWSNPLNTQVNWGREIYPSHLAWVEDGTVNGLLLATGYSPASGVWTSESRDRGVTWRPGSRIAPPGASWTETTITQVGNRLMALCRKDAGANANTIHQSWSDDWGKTWTPPAHLPILPGMSGMPSTTVTSTGAIITCLRHMGTAVSTSIVSGQWTLAWSTDGGASWDVQHLTHEWMLYGQVIQLRNRKLMLIAGTQEPGSPSTSEAWVQARTLTQLSITYPH